MNNLFPRIEREEDKQFASPDADLVPAPDCCELCGKPKDRDDSCLDIDARDFAAWMSALWWKDPRMLGLVCARLMLPIAPLSELACLVGCSKATTTRLWKRLEVAAPVLAAWLRGAERRGGARRNSRTARTANHTNSTKKQPKKWGVG